jgi:hypothetical protein
MVAFSFYENCTAGFFEICLGYVQRSSLMKVYIYTQDVNSVIFQKACAWMFRFCFDRNFKIFCCRGDRLSRLILLICFLNPSMQLPKEYSKFHHDGYLSNPFQVLIYFHPIICCCKLAESATAGSNPGEIIFWGLPARTERLKKVNIYLSSLMMKVPDHVYVLG